MDSKEYYPRLFSSKKKIEKNVPPNIPLNTLRTEKVRNVPPDAITIFGTTDHQSLLSFIKDVGKIGTLEYGTNYVKITFENEADYEKCLKLNHKMVNGQIVGVYRNGIERRDISNKEPGLFRRIISYFF